MIQNTILKQSITKNCYCGFLILIPNGEIGVIDFNRWEIGDPYEEFYKLEIFGTEVSIPFCRGQIDAYFGDNGPPEDFWKILAVYVAHASLYSMFNCGDESVLYWCAI